MVIQPSVVQTNQGPVVVNPSVVIAPAVVTTPQGDKIVVNPKVIDGSINAPKPDPPVQEVAPPSPPPAQAQPATDSGCYPRRQYDMAKVMPFQGEDVFGDQYGQINPTNNN
jgi:hypothetical protein